MYYQNDKIIYTELSVRSLGPFTKTLCAWLYLNSSVDLFDCLTVTNVHTLSGSSIKIAADGVWDNIPHK